MDLFNNFTCGNNDDNVAKYFENARRPVSNGSKLSVSLLTQLKHFNTSKQANPSSSNCTQVYRDSDTSSEFWNKSDDTFDTSGLPDVASSRTLKPFYNQIDQKPFIANTSKVSFPRSKESDSSLLTVKKRKVNSINELENFPCTKLKDRFNFKNGVNNLVSNDVWDSTLKNKIDPKPPLKVFEENKTVEKNYDMEKLVKTYFPSQETLSQKVWHLNCKSKSRKVISFDGKDQNGANKMKKSGEKGFCQLKLSDMLPVKKNVKVSKHEAEKCETDINLDRFKDPEFIEDLALSELDIDFIVDEALKNQNRKEFDAANKCVTNVQKTECNSTNFIGTAKKSKTIKCKNTGKHKHKVQTVLDNNKGQISLKKKEKGKNIKLNANEPSVTANNKRKLKFPPPIKQIIKNVDVNFHIENLNANLITSIREMLLCNSICEVGFTVLFSEGFCQMNKVFGNVDKPCTPYGVMLYLLLLNEDVKYYFIKLQSITPANKESYKALVNELMVSKIGKVCFESQELIMLLADVFSFKREDFCLKWDIIDPKIGCFLLDPDSPPTTFSDVLSQLSLDQHFEIRSNCPKQRAAYYLHLLSISSKRLYELMENNLWKVFISMETRLITILSAMELRGLCVDVTALIEMEMILSNKLKDIENQAYMTVGKCFQLNSPTQLRRILFDELQLDAKYNIAVKKTIKLGAKSTSETVLRSLVSLHPLPGLILNYRHLHKAKVTFVDYMLKQSENGVIRTNWEQTSAATGRIISCNPNLQSIPKQPLNLELLPNEINEGFTPQSLLLRNVFIPHQGYTLVAADFQHIECRVFAHLTQDSVLIEHFQQNTDIFSALAVKWMNKSSIEEVSMEDRDKTKHLVYALMYGAGAQKLSEILHMDIYQTSNIISKFLATFPSLQTFKEKILRKCREQNGILHSLYGRIRKFQNIDSMDQSQRSYSERQAINFVIQGSAADICKLAMIATEHRLSNLPQPLGHHLLLQIHDELVWEVPDENIEMFTDIIEEVMQHSGQFCGELSIPLPISIIKGKSWGQMS